MSEAIVKLTTTPHLKVKCGVCINIYVVRYANGSSCRMGNVIVMVVPITPNSLGDRAWRDDTSQAACLTTVKPRPVPLARL